MAVCDKLTTFFPSAQSWMAAESLVLCLHDELCVSELIAQLIAAAKDISVARRQTAMKLLFLLCSKGEVDLQDHSHNLIGFFLLCLEDRDGATVDSAWDALAAIVKVQAVGIAPCTALHWFGLRAHLDCVPAVHWFGLRAHLDCVPVVHWFGLRAHLDCVPAVHWFGLRAHLDCVPAVHWFGLRAHLDCVPALHWFG